MIDLRAVGKDGIRGGEAGRGQNCVRLIVLVVDACRRLQVILMWFRVARVWLPEMRAPLPVRLG
jgi:hypothetical protein